MPLNSNELCGLNRPLTLPPLFNAPDKPKMMLPENRQTIPHVGVFFIKNTTDRGRKKKATITRFSLVSMGALAYCPALSGTRLEDCQHVNNLLISRNNSGFRQNVFLAPASCGGGDGECD